MEEKQYDVVIIGAGPAGMSAAIYAARAELSALLLEKEAIAGGQIISTYEVDNYPGIYGISGSDLGTKFLEHCNHLGIEHQFGEVKSIYDQENMKKVELVSGECITAKAVIVATGAAHQKLRVPGEEELSGMGVSYCATCDGAFFKNRTVAVVGGGNVAVEDAIFLARVCKKVYLIHRRGELRATKTLIHQLNNIKNVEILYHTIVTSIEGEDMVEKVHVTDNLAENSYELLVQGVFIAVGITPNTSFLKGVMAMDELGFIIAKEDCVTSHPGIFAAGDIRTKQLRQVITAAADGANAVTSVENYILGK